MSYIKSIIQDERVCYFTGTIKDLDVHHIMEGVAFRKKSEKYGLKVYISHNLHLYFHNHNPQELIKLKAIAQKKFEKLHSRDLWMKEFHKNYL